MNGRPFRRRTFLRSLGAAAALAPFVPSFDSEAGGTGFPKRLILLYSGNGTVYPNWLPSGSETSFTLGPILAPLESHKADLIVLGGLRVGREGPGQGHSLGCGALWTGSRLLDDPLFTGMGGASGWCGGTSVDQVVAAASGADTARSSLEFGLQSGGATNASRTIYAGANQPLHPEDDPYAMFDGVFGELDLSPEELERLRSERRSVIDVVKGDLASLEAKLGAAERNKIEAHLQGIREIEMRLEVDGPVAGACEPPVIGDRIDVVANDNFPTLSRLQLDLLVTSLACDLTRVASMQWSRGLSPTRFTWLGIAGEHHELSHAEDAAAQSQLTEINAWYAGEVAYLLDRLEAVPEGDGTMLDNTLVVWGNDLGNGAAHSSYPVPFVMAGSAGGYFETGRFVDYGDALHNRLLVSICHAMGLDDVQTFGDMDTGSGPLPGLV
jgi:hypothetical protein